MRKKFVVATLLTLVLSLVLVGTAWGITNGDPDNYEHPYVGLSVYYDADGNPLWRCSGALLSPTLYLTAGHCVEAPAAHAEIWFLEDVRGANAPTYPFAGPESVGGTPYGHPQYDPNAFYLHDLGVVVLDEPVYLSQYAVLPTEGVIDDLAAGSGKKDLQVEAVGYGLQRSSPVDARDIRFRIRLKALLDVIDVNGTAGIPDGIAIIVSGNHHTGGTCFGDSGGPQLLNGGTVVVAVTSFGLNGTCGGVGGGYRVDTADDLNWLYGTFGAHLP